MRGKQIFGMPIMSGTTIALSGEHMSNLSIAIESPRIIKHYSCSFNFVIWIYAFNDAFTVGATNGLTGYIGYMSAVRWSHVIFIHSRRRYFSASLKLNTRNVDDWRRRQAKEWKNSSRVEMCIKWYVHKFSMFFFLQLNIGITNKHIALSGGVRKHPAIVLSSFFLLFCCHSARFRANIGMFAHLEWNVNFKWRFFIVSHIVGVAWDERIFPVSETGVAWIEWRVECCSWR